MINKLLEAVIKKHGYLTIDKINSSHGIFRIVTASKSKDTVDSVVKTGQMKSIAKAVECFDIETGLINLLGEDKLNEDD